MICSQCQKTAEFKGYRPTSAESLLGTIRFRRAYYHCARCGLGHCPFDAEVGLGEHRVTPGAERLASLLGLTCDGFEEAATKVLPEACGLHLGESTVQRITEDAGARLGQLHEQGHTLGDSQPFAWHKDAQGRTCAYISVDLTSVPQQAADGGPAEGRMPYVATLYNPVPETPGATTPSVAQPALVSSVTPLVPDAAAVPSSPAPTRSPTTGTAVPAPKRMQARYVAGLFTLTTLGLLLRKQAGQVGLEQAEQWIGLSDGGNGLENFLRTNFNRPNLVVILDFWHPTGYLEDLARAWYPDHAEQRERLSQQWCHTLKHQGGAALVAELQGLALPRRNRAVQAAYTAALEYLQNNVHRMDYPSYLAQGWQIGSGPVESACKTVVGQRLKQAGMRWREYGTDNVCHLRAWFKSDKGQWDAFWERKVN